MTATWQTYEQAEGERFSRLKLLLDSPAHYRHACDHPSPGTSATDLGRYVHTAILSPDLLDHDFAIYPGPRRAGKEWDAFSAYHADRTIFKQSEIDEIAPLIRAIQTHPAPRKLLQGGEAERILQWTDPTTGIRLKARPDYIRAGAVIDLKTTRSIDARRFGHDIARFSYHGQLAHYADGIASVLGWQPEAHILIAVEKDPPYDLAVFELDADTIEVGRLLVRDCLARLAECRASGVWPGRYTAPVQLGAHNLPPWMFGGGIPEFEFVEEGAWT